MKRALPLLSLSVLACLVCASGASAAHVQCGDVLTQDTTLDSDLVCPGDGLRIGADGVTLDLNGHEIRGPGSTTGAVAVLNQRPTPEDPRGFNDMTVTNGRIADFSVAVRVQDSTGGDIARLRTPNALMLERADGYLVRRNVAGSISLLDGDSNVVRGNGVSSIFMLRGADNVFDANLVSQPTGNSTAISIGTAVNTRVTRNVVRGGGFSGIEVAGFSVNTVVAANYVSGAGVGIWLSSTRQTTVSSNYVIDSAEDGVRVAFSQDTVVERNFAKRNGDDGIDVDSVPTTVTRNRANKNGDLGIEAAAGVTDGGGNMARGNGNPAQCVGVTCS